LTRAESKRSGFNRGASLGRRVTQDPHHQPPAHGGSLCLRHGTRPPLARRRRRARLPSAFGLDGSRRPHGHSPHHGPRLAACHLVAYRDEGISKPASAPVRSILGPMDGKNPGAAVAAPGVEGQQPIQNAATFAVAQAAVLTRPGIPPGNCVPAWARTPRRA